LCSEQTATMAGGPWAVTDHRHHPGGWMETTCSHMNKLPLCHSCPGCEQNSSRANGTGRRDYWAADSPFSLTIVALRTVDSSAWRDSDMVACDARYDAHARDATPFDSSAPLRPLFHGTGTTQTVAAALDRATWTSCDISVADNGGQCCAGSGGQGGRLARTTPPRQRRRSSIYSGQQGSLG